MSEVVLYEKRVSPSGKVSYVPHIPAMKVVEVPEKVPVPQCSEFSNEELITWTASLVMIQIMILERQLPSHTLIARKGKLKVVEDALLDLVRGLGAPLDDGLVNYVTDTWNLAMKMMQEGLVEEHEKHMHQLDETMTCNAINCDKHHGICSTCNNENFTIGRDKSPCTVCCSEGGKCQYNPK
jgi:hypothetical protein